MRPLQQWNVVLTASAILQLISSSHAETILSLDLSAPSVGELKRFWDSTGLCPLGEPAARAEYLLSDSELFNLAIIGSLPRRGISQVRIHWLLDLITVNSSAPGYDFSSLDRLLDWLHTYRLYPGFELMGNPSQLFTDFSDDTQVGEWRRLVGLVATRYIERYGLDSVARWRFETWNEPDLEGYNVVNFTLQSYLRYFNSSVQGLQDAGQGRLRIGGPAGLLEDREKHPLCWGLLEHCAGMLDCPLDFISFHRKGGGHGAAILDQDMELGQDITNMFPSLARVPFANDESDPLTNWSLNETWRGDVRYGAIVASVIAAHQKVMVTQHGLPLGLLSNDNAFLNYHPFYFTQRTLLARFQMNRTEPPHVQVIRKPVFSTMALLSFLGNRELNVSVTASDERLSVLAAEETGSTAVLVVCSNDTEADPDTVLTVDLRMLSVDDGARYVVYLLDNTVTNPQQVWLEAGSPDFPDQRLRDTMRRAEGPFRLKGPTEVPSSGNLSTTLSLSLPSVALLHVCSSTEPPPGQVTRVLACNVTHNEVMLFWSDEVVFTRCVKTYEVEFSPGGPEGFRRVNTEDTIFLSYQHVETSGSEQVAGLYRVRAVDYWDRAGPFSSPITYPGDYPCP